MTIFVHLLLRLTPPLLPDTPPTVSPPLPWTRRPDCRAPGTGMEPPRYPVPTPISNTKLDLQRYLVSRSTDSYTRARQPRGLPDIPLDATLWTYINYTRNYPYCTETQKPVRVHHEL